MGKIILRWSGVAVAKEGFFHIFVLYKKLSMNKKFIADLPVISNQSIGCGHYMLTVSTRTITPNIKPGQFVEIRIKGADGVMLRRPISIHDFSAENNSLSLLIHKVGKGTEALSGVKVGDMLDVILPLGNGFDLESAGDRPLLVGGGVGVAPLYLLAKALKNRGAEPTILLGAKTINDVLCLEKFREVAPVIIATEDGSEGTKGFVTDCECFKSEELRRFTSVLQCGPTPMMKAVAAKSKAAGVLCYASLENMMACGFGVCLCCVTDTLDGNRRVCSDGPVFNVKELKW